MGRGVAQRIACEGAAVAVADVSPERNAVAADLTAAGHAALAIPLDVRVAADHANALAAVLERFGRLDTLIYCAGIYPRASLLETDETLWHRVIDVNLTGAFLACRAVVPYLAAHGGGSIVTLGSLHARRGSSNLVAYSVAKGGLLTLTRNLAASYARDQIRVNCVQPGWVLTEGELAVRGLQPEQAAQYAEETKARIPLGRLQTPEDIAAMVAFLISNEASQITGQVIGVDGGMGGRW
jgi:NAD(P)-dependent dehydrogenase (short-subunit alcohol dehydrogenase family)